MDASSSVSSPSLLSGPLSPSSLRASSWRVSDRPEENLPLLRLSCSTEFKENSDSFVVGGENNLERDLVGLDTDSAPAEKLSSKWSNGNSRFRQDPTLVSAGDDSARSVHSKSFSNDGWGKNRGASEGGCGVLQVL